MKVFISYSSEDKGFARRLERDLRERAGAETWLDQLEIMPGDLIPGAIEGGLMEADVFLLVLSPDSASSRWVDYERQAWLTLQIKEEQRAVAESRPPGRRLVPILYRDCELPAFLQPLRYVRMTDGEYQAGLQDLLRALGDGAPKTDAGVPPAPNGLLATSPSRRKYASYLKSLLPAQFDEVVFVYGCPHSLLPSGVSQVQKAIALIQLAEQQEGDSVEGLLEAILESAPALRTR